MSWPSTCISGLAALAMGIAGAFVIAVPHPAAGQGLESALMPGKVIKGHAKLESACTNCHVRFQRAAQPGLCLGCHKDVAADVRAAAGYHGRLPEAECRTCHTEHKGRAAKIVVLDEPRFDHGRTDFPLQGKHAGPPCASCHRPGTKHRTAPSECGGCHARHDRHRGNLGPKCDACHTTTDWKGTRFDHAKTRFPLRLRHAEVKCAGCHAEERYANTALDCVSCHRKHDAHKGHLGPRCDRCHQEGDWKTTTFVHDRDTKFALRDRHRVVKCAGCHKAALAAGPVTPAAGPADRTPAACPACHRRDDVHKGALREPCERCHTERGWKETRFDHDRDSRFPLRDRHRPVKCAGCHPRPEYREMPPSTCVGCHERDDREKAHRGRYGSRCGACHHEKGWKVLIFDHDRDTRYRLIERHRVVTCDGCHARAGFRDAPSACVGCHERDDREKAHRGRYGEQCATCHREKGWKALVFDHDRDTRQALRGKHREVKCDACHRGALYRDRADTRCVACHQADDKHRGQLGPACETCHDERRWREARFDHGRSRFPLRDAHARVECRQCHPTPAFKDAKTACVSCHAKADKHNERLGARCEQCHDVRSWKGSAFDHGRTRFALGGAHAKIACVTCHTRPARDKLDAVADCFACHRKDDTHLGSFGRQCDRCHVADTWRRIVKREGVQ